jgi:nicotinate phosphoribosyltransferase
MNHQIISDLADTDLYKLTMLKWVVQHYPEARVRYELKIRKDVEFTAADEAEIRHQFDLLRHIGFGSAALARLAKTAPFLDMGFLTYLQGVCVTPSDIHIWRDKAHHLHGLVEGVWAGTIFWEIVALATISEVYFANHFPPLTEAQKRQIYQDAYDKGKGFRDRKAYFIEMGTRRRYSLEVQRLVIQGLKDGAGEYLLGTSNVMLAAEFGLRPQGTMAHEIYSAVAAMTGVENANNIVLGKWADTYHGNLGICLPDTFTTAFFLRTYNPFYAKLYDGLRHDSHKEPNVWTDMVLDHLRALSVDARTKKLIYSDGIDSFARVDDILCYRAGECLKSFGVGTWLTNDLRAINGAEALNVVMKLVAAQKNLYEPMRPACKLSDVEGKEMGDPHTVEEYKRKVADTPQVLPLATLLSAV